MDDPRPGDPNANPNRPQNPAGPQAGRPQQPQGVSGVMPSTGVMVGSSGYPTQQAQAWSPPPGVYTPPQPQMQARPPQPPPGAVTARVTSAFMYVKSIEKSIEFYAEAMGAQVSQRHAEVEGGPLTLAILRMGDFSLMLHIADPEDMDLKENRVGVGIHLQLRVSNVDIAFDRACDAGYHARVSDGPVDQEWGWREFAIKDPDGYIWSIYQDNTNGAWMA